VSRLLKNEAPISLIILSYKGTLASELLPYGFLIERTTCSFENPQIHFEYKIDFGEIFESEAQFFASSQNKRRIGYSLVLDPIVHLNSKL
jgi:hypothetical protein